MDKLVRPDSCTVWSLRHSVSSAPASQAWNCSLFSNPRLSHTKSRENFSAVVVTEASGQGGCPLRAVKSDHALLQSTPAALTM